MVTEAEWKEIERRVDAWQEWRLKKAAERAKRAAEQVAEDAKVDPEILHKPTTI